MDRDFWHERWQRREIGFHQFDIHWALKRHWSEISKEHSGGVLVPLCGKSLDMRWLAERGHLVVGVELNRQAVGEFYNEWGKKPKRNQAGSLHHWQAGKVEIFEGDFFEFRAGKPFELVYDRAALVAMPREIRSHYLSHLRALLTDDARGLLITFEYEQHRMDGPPFSVTYEELMHFSGLRFELLERRDALSEHSGFAQRGLRALEECAWLVTAD